MEYKMLVFWGCVALAVIIACGYGTFDKLHVVCRKLCFINRKYHIVEFGNDSIYSIEDDDDDVEF